jgi:hypothetical protein
MEGAKIMITEQQYVDIGKMAVSFVQVYRRLEAVSTEVKDQAKKAEQHAKSHPESGLSVAIHAMAEITKFKDLQDGLDRAFVALLVIVDKLEQ